MSPTRARNTLCAGSVQRYHAAPSVMPQTVGLHSWGVAVLCMFLTDGKPSASLLAAAILHDAGELFTGDIPFTVKKANAEVKRIFDELEDETQTSLLVTNRLPPLTEDEKCILKLSDTLDGLAWCRKHEREGPVYDRWVGALNRAKEKFVDTVGLGVMAQVTYLEQLIQTQPYV